MDIETIIFCKNDFKFLQGCLTNFRKFNDEHVCVINCGGDSPQDKFATIENISFVDIPDIWNKGFSYSFSYDWFKYFFEIGLQHDYTVLLETDVITLRKFKETDFTDYDFIGRFGRCSPNEDFLYEYFNLKDPYLHSCAGGTIFKKSYFEKCEKNLYKIEECFEKFKNNFYQDMMTTLLGRISNCTFNYWDGCVSKETSDCYAEGRYFKVDYNDPIFVHPYKEF